MVWTTKLPALRWVSTDAHDIVVHEGTEWRAAFFRLFNYIDGTNSEDTKIPMTKPVSARYIGSNGYVNFSQVKLIANFGQPWIQGYLSTYWIWSICAG